MSTTQKRPMLGEILVKTGLVSADDLNSALEEQKASNGTMRLGEILYRRGRIGFTMLSWALKEQEPQLA